MIELPASSMRALVNFNIINSVLFANEALMLQNQVKKSSADSTYRCTFAIFTEPIGSLIFRKTLHCGTHQMKCSLTRSITEDQVSSLLTNSTDSIILQKTIRLHPKQQENSLHLEYHQEEEQLLSSESEQQLQL
jgi:hypothetical protein